MFTNLIISESPMITKGDDGVVYVDKEKLRNVKTERIENNVVFFREPSGNMFFEKGTTWIYFMDSEESAQKMDQGEIGMIVLPQGRAIGSMGQKTPFEKSLTIPDDKRRGKGTEHILGFIQGFSDEDEIYVDYMKVRTGYRKNSINQKMIQIIQKEFPSAEVVFSKPTKLGKGFINKNYPDSKIK